MMSDKYYRGLRNIINDTKHKLQLASMTLKINENKNNISGIKNDISEINNFSNKIDDNETSISSNLKIINTNKNNISFNLEQITDIKSLLPKSEFFKKTYGITNQSFRFTRNIIYFKLLEIEIENNFNKDGRLEIDSDIYYKYNNLQKDHHRLQHEYQIYDDKNNLLHKKILNKTNASDLDFDKNVMLVKDNFYVIFNNNYNKITILLYLFRVYRHGAGNFNLELINENFVNITYLDKNDISLKIDTNKNNISSNLLEISNNKNDIASNLSKINNNSSDISSNLSKINNNSSDISSNLSKINNNSSDISSNLNEINYLKNNKSTQYLKIVYNILIYESKTQIDFRENIFYEKVFDVNANQNDFLEIFFKIQLEYRDIDDRHYVKSIFQILDENNNSLYIKSVNNNQYNYFSNKMTIDENIFYNFTNNIKKLKFLIKFQKLSSTRVVYLYYIKNDNHRLILKHYGN